MKNTPEFLSAIAAAFLDHMSTDPNNKPSPSLQAAIDGLSSDETKIVAQAMFDALKKDPSALQSAIDKLGGSAATLSTAELDVCKARGLDPRTVATRKAKALARRVATSKR